MKVRLSLKFDPHSFEPAVVTALDGIRPIMTITIDLWSGADHRGHKITSEADRCLDHTDQAKVILAATTLVQSVLTGQDALSVLCL
jgi:hypothetical protein